MKRRSRPTLHRSEQQSNTEVDWSQAQLADRLGVSRQTIHALETGMYDPRLPLALKIARLFDRLIEEIFDPEEEPLERKRPA